MVLICSDQGGYDQDDGYSFRGECMLCFFFGHPAVRSAIVQLVYLLQGIR